MWKPWQYKQPDAGMPADPRPLVHEGWYIYHPRFGTRGDNGKPFVSWADARYECARREKILRELYAAGESV